MPVSRFYSTELPPMFIVSTPTTLFTIGKEQYGDRFFAFRNKAPQFVLQGDDLQELYSEATGIIDKFLDKIHRYGFRS